MTWVSSTRLVDYFEELDVVTLQATDDVPALADARLGRVAGINHNRDVTSPVSMEGPYFKYDLRDWDGASATVPQSGVFDLGDDWDMPVGAVLESDYGVSYRDESVIYVEPVGVTWAALGGAPDSAPITIVMGLANAVSTLDVAANVDCYFYLDGTCYLEAEAYGYSTQFGSESGGMYCDFSSGSDEVWFNTPTSDTITAAVRAGGVFVFTIDLPTLTQRNLWINGDAVAGIEDDHGGGYLTGPPYPVFDDEDATITEFMVYFDRDVPASNQGPLHGGNTFAIYRGIPTEDDLVALQALYGPGY